MVIGLRFSEVETALPVLHDSPRVADDDRRERLYKMKKYGIWNVVILTNDGEVVRRDVTATSGKDAKSRMCAIYQECEILKMTRKTWLSGFSFSQLSAALMDFSPDYADALLTILDDCGVFSTSVEEAADGE